MTFLEDHPTSEILEDFSLVSVPLDRRKSWVDLAVIWIGIAVVMSAIFRGMMVGLGLGKIPRILLSYGLGEGLLIAVMVMAGYVGAKTGLSTPLIANIVFGRIGAAIVSLSIAFSLIGWFGVQAGLFARTVRFFFNFSLSLPLLSFLCGMLMMIPAIFGIRGLSTLSWAASPVMLVILAWGALKTGFRFLPPDTLVALAEAHRPDPYPLTVGAAASIIAGGFIVGATTSADIFRYAKPRKKEIAGAAVLAMTASAVLHLVGSVLSMHTGVYHERLPELIMDERYLGFGLVGFVVLLLAQWTTNDSNLYSSVLALNNLFRVKRWKMAVAAGFLASLVAAAGILERLELFLTLLTVGIGPVSGIFFCDFYLLKKQAFRPPLIRRGTTTNRNALAAYLISVGVGWITSGHPFILPVFPFSVFAFNGILCSVAVYMLLEKTSRKKEDAHGP